MPAFITHNEFGSDVLSHVKTLVPSDPESRLAFRWGLQGPDILFFHRAIRGNSPLPGYGNRMHRERTAELFTELCRYVMDHRDQADVCILLAYVQGFTCHYALDRHTHPYIYYQQEKWKENLPTKVHRGVHNRIESDIDSLIYLARTGKTVSHCQPKRVFEVTPSVLMPLGMLYEQILNKLYQVQVPASDVVDAIISGRKLFSLMVDRTDFITFNAVKLGEFLIRKPGVFDGSIKRNQPGWDALNLKHAFWHNLARPAPPTSASFWDLWENANQEACERIREMTRCIIGGVEYLPGEMLSFDDGAPVPQLDPPILPPQET